MFLHPVRKQLAVVLARPELLAFEFWKKSDAALNL
jgi:hypothetical protein